MIGDITTGECRRIQKKMLARGNRKPATINRHFSYLRRVLSLAVKDGEINRNPMTGVKFFPEEKRTRYLSDVELKQLQNVMNPKDWELVAFAVETGLRRGEQFKLRWNQVSLETSTLILPLSKGGKSRHVPLSDVAKQILRSRDSFLFSPWVFPRKIDPKKAESAQYFVKTVYMTALHRAAITDACWHTLRHLAASRRVMAGVDLYAVKKILGHRDISTTERYAHLAPGFLQEAVNRGSLSGPVTTTVTRDEGATRPKDTKESQHVENI